MESRRVQDFCLYPNLDRHSDADIDVLQSDVFYSALFWKYGANADRAADQLVTDVYDQRFFLLLTGSIPISGVQVKQLLPASEVFLTSAKKV